MEQNGTSQSWFIKNIRITTGNKQYIDNLIKYQISDNAVISILTRYRKIFWKSLEIVLTYLRTYDNIYSVQGKGGTQYD